MAAELPGRDELDHGRDEVWKGVVAGAAGGLVATFAMTQFQQLAKRLADEPREVHNEQHSLDRGKEKSARPSEPKEGSEDATVQAAARLSEKVFHHELTETEKSIAGPALHYAFGAAVGALYGGLAEVTPAVARGGGVPFGTAVWLAADEIAVPAFKLSKGPAAYPVSVHASALGAHLVYGLATDLVRRLLRRALA